jgi:hypothetical protein
MRFAVDDEVLCCMGGRAKKGKAGRSRSEWKKAVVVRVLPEEMPDFAYQCKLVESGDLIWAPVDKDQCISKVGLPALDRLMESIEQKCPVSHLEWIVSHHRIELLVVADSVLRKAALSGNKEAFFWLTEECNLNANQCKGPKGRNILHMFASAESVDFFEELGQKEMDDSYTNKNVSVSKLLKESDADGQTVLHIAASRAGKLPELLRVLLDPIGLGKRIGHCWDIDRSPCKDAPSFCRLYHANMLCWTDAKGRTASDICKVLKNKGDMAIHKFQMMLAFSNIFG